MYFSRFHIAIHLLMLSYLSTSGWKLICPGFCPFETTQYHVYLTVSPAIVTYFFCFRISQINISLCHFIWFSVSMTAWIAKEPTNIYLSIWQHCLSFWYFGMWILQIFVILTIRKTWNDLNSHLCHAGSHKVSYSCNS